MQFVGGTIYCSEKGGRLNLGTSHRYERSFVCPACGEFVVGRLDERPARFRRLIAENKDILDRLAAESDSDV